jgi:predicted  nucleic acid-binding Zn-ribbon protein
MTKEEFLHVCEEQGAFKEGLLNASFVKYIKHRPELASELSRLSSGDTISEQLFLLTKERTYCEVCGKPTVFKSYGEGYRRFCSAECRKESTVRKAKATNLKRYGAPTPAQNKAIKAKMNKTLKERYGVDNAFALASRPKNLNLEKRRKTMLERYGVEYPLQSPEIKQKIAQTNLQRYGNISSVHSEQIQEKIKENNIEKYGVEYSSQRKDVIEKIRTSRRANTYKRLFASDRLRDRVIPLFDVAQYTGVREPHTFQCTRCGHVFEDNLINGSIPRCDVCYPLHVNSRNPLEDEIALYITSLLPHVRIIYNDRDVLAGKELDLYLPDYKLAIELNELYFHSELMGRGRGYHLNKTTLCEKQGIRLLHIFEDEWLDKQEIIKSIISNALGIRNHTIGARQLTPKFNVDLTDFFDDNHIQGNVGASIKVGLLDEKGEVLAGMSFRKPRYSKQADYELARFAVKIGYHIPGAFSRLLSLFRKHYSGSIITFSERRLFTGDVYRKTGFRELKPTPPSYWYTTGYKYRENRLNYQKHKILDADPTLTEYENMQLKGYTRIWDCGNWKFVLE